MKKTTCNIIFKDEDIVTYMVNKKDEWKKVPVFMYPMNGENRFYVKIKDFLVNIFDYSYSTSIKMSYIEELDYPDVIYAKYIDKQPAQPSPYIALEEELISKLSEKYSKLRDLDHTFFDDIMNNIINRNKEFYVDTEKGIINSTENPTIANLNELVCDIKSKYKEFIAEEAIDKITDYIAQNIIVFVEDKENKKQQDEINSLSDQVDELRKENEELLKENHEIRKLNNEMKSAMCHIANEVSPFIKKMNDTELIMRSLFSGNITEDTKFGESRENDVESEENNIKTKENEVIEFDYSRLKTFVDKMRNGIGNEMSKKWNLPIRNVIHRFTQEACGSYYHVTYENAVKTNMENGSCVYSITDELLAMFFLKNIKESNFDYSKDNVGNNIYSDFIVKDENFNNNDISKGLMKESQYLAILSNNLTEVFTKLKPSEIQEKDIDYLYNYCEEHLYDKYGGHRPICVDIKPEYR